MIRLISHKVMVLWLGLLAGLVFHLQWLLPAAFAATAENLKSAVIIRVHTNNTVSGDQIVLGDIAEVAADPFLLENINRIEIESSPEPDRIKTIDRNRILYRIKAKDYLPEKTRIVCPEKVFVKRPGQQLSKKRIRTFLNQQLEKVLDSQTFKIEKLSVRGLESYPEGEISFSVSPDELRGKNGRVTAYLNIYVDSVRVDRVSLSAQIQVFKDVLFAARSIPRGEILNINDFYCKKVNIHDYHHRVVKSASGIAGKILKTSLRKDQALKPNQISDPPMVRKGQLISLTAGRGQLSIVTRGISKEDGYENDLISVENIQSGKLVRGVVKEKSKVEVVY